MSHCLSLNYLQLFLIVDFLFQHSVIAIRLILFDFDRVMAIMDLKYL